jgi:hypothetical protein
MRYVIVQMAAHLRMAALTIERTAAFMPALSPPDVRTAIFIVGLVRTLSEIKRCGIGAQRVDSSRV